MAFYNFLILSKHRFTLQFLSSHAEIVFYSVNRTPSKNPSSMFVPKVSYLRMQHCVTLSSIKHHVYSGSACTLFLFGCALLNLKSQNSKSFPIMSRDIEFDFSKVIRDLIFEMSGREQALTFNLYPSF